MNYKTKCLKSRYELEDPKIKRGHSDGKFFTRRNKPGKHALLSQIMKPKTDVDDVVKQ